MRNVVGFLVVLLLLGVQVVAAGSGAELVSVTVSHPGGIASYSPGDNIVLSQGNVRVSLAFKSLRGGEQSFVVSAPFARDVLSSTGVVTRTENLWVLKMYGLRGQSFTLDIIGTLESNSYIDIIQGGDIPVKIAYISLHVKEKSESAVVNQSNTSSIQKLYRLAEANIATLKSRGMDVSLLEAKLENARLKIRINEAETIEILNSVIEETQKSIDYINTLELRLADLKTRADTENMVDNVGPILLQAENAIRANNFEAAEKYLKDAENELKPSILRDIKPYAIYIILAIAFGIMVRLFYRRKGRNTNEWMGI